MTRMHLARRTLLGLLAAALLVLASGSRPAQAGGKAPDTFVLNYCWGAGWPSFGVCPSATLTLYANHTVIAVDGATGDTGSGQWSTGKKASTISFVFPGATYAGAQVSPGCYQGTMTSPNIYGGGTWAGCYVP